MIADSDPFSGDRQLEQDLDLLESLRRARKEFVDQICMASASKDERLLANLRLEPTYQLAEFYYSLRAYRISTEDDLKRMAELHNEYVVGLIKDPAKLRRFGLTSERALDAMVTGDVMPRLLQNWRECAGALDQSNLARFLVAVMSTETCRKAVIACTEAGFLQRKRTPYGTMLITSGGILEGIFGGCLRNLRLRLKGE